MNINLEGSPELNQFKSLAYERVNEYYDLEGAIKNLGHNPDEIEEIGFDIETDELTYSYRLPSGKLIEIINPPTISKTDLCIDDEKIKAVRGEPNDLHLKKSN